MIRVRGAGLAVLIGVASMLAGALLLLPLRSCSPVAALLAATLVLGMPNAFSNLGLQAALFGSRRGNASDR